ncbi:MAG: S49 family peptidase [bacterium]|nr:S49 family peptidase [bacterium]
MPNWRDILSEIQKVQSSGGPNAPHAIDFVRHKYLRKLRQTVGRNVIAYYSGFLSKPEISQTDINDEDKNGFMAVIHRLDRSKGLDLLLHTPGGGIAATESIVDYLLKMFNGDIRAIVPQIAMSAGTMMACCCKSILMAEHSNLGPIDPHLRGIPAVAVIKEFKRVYREVVKDPNKFTVWEPIIKQYRPTFLSQCESVIQWSKGFVQSHLETQMFAGDPDAKRKAEKITRALLSYQRNKSHDKHLHLQDCQDIGLKIERIEDSNRLQDAILTVHHCYMHTLMNTSAFKVIENHNGVAFVKAQQVVQIQNTPK